MIPAQNTFNSKDIRLPLLFIFSGLILFIVAQSLLLNGTNSLTIDVARIPTIWAAVHILILGFAVMITMGAMYQLVPVAMQVNIFSIRLGYSQYVLYVVGVLGISWGFIDFSPSRLVIFSLITLIAIILFEINMWISIRGAKKTEIGFAIKLSLIYFFLTILFGIWLALDFLIPHLDEWHDRFLYIHIIFGTVGWFTLIIIGFSYKLIPMFTLSHGYESKLPQYTIHFINLGILLIVGQQVTRYDTFAWLGYSLILAGLLCFMLQIRIILSKRLKKNLDLGVKVALCAWPISIVSIITVILTSVSINQTVHITAVVYVVLTGWISLSILGYLFKILPFLWWTYRYSEKIGKAKVLSLKEMTNEKNGKCIFIMIFLCMLANIIAMVLNMPMMFRISQIILVLTSIAYFFEMIKVLSK
ncbi:hypothetical protein [Metabacillus malikii]|uniref:Cytochrome C and Quinol oxidase polypeptide I n=1 Tax=Metabacillus malikii TaxID=1504265 RepID=A0ABT9ZAN1_9BACI|nr:hypothetical protein [Metabacillus malikii]MDQ0229277.1 hypothetical protein [Metabacillus malikii]